MASRVVPTNVHVISLHGEIDASRKDATEREMRQLDDLRDAFVIIDLTDVTRIDATLLKLLLQLRERLHQRSDETIVTIVAAPASKVVRVLSVTGFDARFEIFNDISSAQKVAFAGPLGVLGEGSI